MVVLAPFTNMPDDVKALAEETKKEIVEGRIHPFQGPVVKQDGSVAVKAGEEIAPDIAAAQLAQLVGGERLHGKEALRDLIARHQPAAMLAQGSFVDPGAGG